MLPSVLTGHPPSVGEVEASSVPGSRWRLTGLAVVSAHTQQAKYGGSRCDSRWGEGAFERTKAIPVVRGSTKPGRIKSGERRRKVC